MNPEEKRAKHLEFIQKVISRLAHNSFLVKGWSIAVASAAYGLSIDKTQWLFALGGSAAVAILWILDAYYLHVEKMYRRLYAEAIKDAPSIPIYSLDYTRFETRRITSIVKTAVSLTQAGLHFPIFIAGLVLTHALYCPY